MTNARTKMLLVAYTDEFVVVNAKCRLLAEDDVDMTVLAPPFPELTRLLNERKIRFLCFERFEHLRNPRAQTMRRLADVALIRRLRRERFDRVVVWTRHTGLRAAPFLLFGWLVGADRCLAFWDGKQLVDISGPFRLAKALFRLFDSKGRWQWMLSGLSRRLRLSRALGMPTTLEIEPASVCNLRCPMCKTGIRELTRSAQLMSLDVFRRIIAEVGWHTNRVLLYGTGEPMANPAIYDMIRVAREAGIVISICTNGDLVDGKRLAHAQPEEVYFAVDGADPATHAVYRKGSDLTRVLQNMRDTLNERRRLGNTLPEVIMSSIVMKQNEHQLDAIRQIAIDLGVDRLQVTKCGVWTKAQADAFLPTNPAYVQYQLDELTRGRIRHQTLGQSMCEAIWHYAIITADGTIGPCCGVELPIPQPDGTLSYEHDPRFFPMGDAKAPRGFRAAWNSPKFLALRQAILNKRYEGHCTLCSGYRAPELVPAAWGVKMPVQAVSRVGSAQAVKADAPAEETVAT